MSNEISDNYGAIGKPLDTLTARGSGKLEFYQNGCLYKSQMKDLNVFIAYTKLKEIFEDNFENHEQFMQVINNNTKSFFHIVIDNVEEWVKEGYATAYTHDEDGTLDNPTDIKL